MGLRVDFQLVPNSSSFDFRSQQLDAVPLSSIPRAPSPQCSPCRLWKREVQGEAWERYPPAQSSWSTPNEILCPLGSASVWEGLRDLHSSQVSPVASSQGIPSPWHYHLIACAGCQREGGLTPVPPLIPSLLLSAVGFIIRICTVYCV